MKKTLTLTESELVEVINVLIESYNDEIYDEEDYVEVFFKYFRPWVKKKHGDEIGEYPFSYLAKKYMSEFVSDHQMNPNEIVFSYSNTMRNAGSVGKQFVKQGKHKLPSLRSQVMFTEKYKKQLSFFIEKLELPDFLKIVLTEKTPYNLSIRLNVDWNKLIKYQGDKIFRPSDIENELQKRIKNFLGVELGNPTHGKLSITFDKEYLGVEEWVKKTLNKDIKKKIKELPKSNILHAVKFETFGSHLGGQLKLSFKSWTGRNDFTKSVKELLQQMGYNTNILKVSN